MRVGTSGYMNTCPGWRMPVFTRCSFTQDSPVDPAWAPTLNRPAFRSSRVTFEPERTATLFVTVKYGFVKATSFSRSGVIVIPE
ncbi:MAG: hypothetical protein A4E37_01967 [Methanoregulaceae archaeon PtaB.Bin056]|nr:MAG: hypothetical protein A4E37_01967 [Methanoregulaceae archaeon PtaB.Bin056]